MKNGIVDEGARIQSGARAPLSRTLARIVGMVLRIARRGRRRNRHEVFFEI